MKRILIIDDEELIIKSLSKLLEKNGYDVFIAKTGQDAIIMVEEEDFDLIIADIRMPGLNGVETIKKIYEAREREKIPVVFITGYADDNLAEEARKLEPVTFLYKPFDILALMDKVKEKLK